MSHALDAWAEQAGELVHVIYSMTVEEPRYLQAVGLNFQGVAMTFRATATGIRSERFRLCGAGVCADTEHCYLADGTRPWCVLLGVCPAQLLTHSNPAGHIQRVSLMFAGRETVIVDLVWEAGVLRVVDSRDEGST